MVDTVLITPIGHLGLKFQGLKLSRVEFLASHIIPMSAKAHPPSLKKTIHCIETFFTSPHSLTSIPHVWQGTAFQRLVLKALKKIPLGQTRTYGEIAATLGTSARAVGNACRANPLPLVIPCHRVVGARDIGGFCGATSGPRHAIKSWLLAHEQG